MTLNRFCVLVFFYCILGDKTAAQQGIAFPPNPHANWYLLSPSAYAPPPGKAIFQNGLLAASQYQKTTPNGNTYTIGFIPTLLLGESNMPMWVSAHRRIPIGVCAKIGRLPSVSHNDSKTPAFFYRLLQQPKLRPFALLRYVFVPKKKSPAREINSAEHCSFSRARDVSNPIISPVHVL